MNLAIRSGNISFGATNSLVVKDVLKKAVMQLQAAKIASASLDARILMENVLGVGREQLLFSLDLLLTEEQYDRMSVMLEKRVERRPLAQIIGKREFWGLNFTVNEKTLDPRPDSETLIEAVLERLVSRGSVLRFLDLGTGTGCLLLSILSELPLASAVGVDCSDDALSVARINAINLSLSERVDFICSDWLVALKDKGVKFDFIVSNPPYIPSREIDFLAPEVGKFEPRGALDGGEDGLDCYRSIMREIAEFLIDDGFLAFEIGIGQEKKLSKIAEDNNFKVVGIKNDLSGIPRCVLLQKNHN